MPVIAPRVRAAFRSCVYARSSQSPRQVRRQCWCVGGGQVQRRGEKNKEEARELRAGDRACAREILNLGLGQRLS